MLYKKDLSYQISTATPGTCNSNSSPVDCQAMLSKGLVFVLVVLLLFDVTESRKPQLNRQSFAGIRPMCFKGRCAGRKRTVEEFNIPSKDSTLEEEVFLQNLE